MPPNPSAIPGIPSTPGAIPGGVRPTPGAMPPGGIPAASRAHPPDTWVSRADVYEEDGDYVIITDIPGIAPDTLDLTWDGAELVLEANTRSPEKPERKPVVRERPRGSYYRRIALRPDLDPVGAVASYSDGILEVRVPRKPRRTRRAVHVTRPGHHPGS